MRETEGRNRSGSKTYSPASQTEGERVWGNGERMRGVGYTYSKRDGIPNTR